MTPRDARRAIAYEERRCSSAPVGDDVLIPKRRHATTPTARDHRAVERAEARAGTRRRVETPAAHRPAGAFAHPDRRRVTAALAESERIASSLGQIVTRTDRHARAHQLAQRLKEELRLLACDIDRVLDAQAAQAARTQEKTP